MSSSEPIPGALVSSARRAFETLAASLDPSRWDDDAGRVAHARTLVMIGRRDLAHAALADGGVQCAIMRMHLCHDEDDLEAAVAIGHDAILRFPSHALGLRNSTASMLAALDRHDEALALIRDNVTAAPDEPVWRELEAMLAAPRDDGPPDGGQPGSARPSGGEDA